MKRRHSFELVLLVLVLLSLACTAVTNLVATPTPVPTSTPVPTFTAIPTDTAIPTPVVRDSFLEETEFDADSCFRQMQSDEDVERYVQDGQFHINVKTADLSAWEFCENVPFDDFIVEAEATQLNGPDGNGYGLILRSTGDQFYLFLIGGDGYYAFVHYGLDVDPEFIIDWTESAAVNQGNQTNILKAEAVGSNFKLYINGQLVDEAQDDRLTAGDVGFFVLSSDQNGLDVAFDNLTVSRP